MSAVNNTVHARLLIKVELRTINQVPAQEHFHSSLQLSEYITLEPLAFEEPRNSVAERADSFRDQGSYCFGFSLRLLCLSANLSLNLHRLIIQLFTWIIV